MYHHHHHQQQQRRQWLRVVALLLLASCCCQVVSSFVTAPFVASSRPSFFSQKASSRVVLAAAASSSTSSTSSTTDQKVKSDTEYYSSTFSSSSEQQQQQQQRITLTRFLKYKVKRNPELRDLEFLLSIQMACKIISNLVNRCGLVYSGGGTTTNNNDDDANSSERFPPQDGRFYSMKRLDQLSTNVLRNALRFTGKCEMVTTPKFEELEQQEQQQPAEQQQQQHQPGVLIASSLDSNYVAVLDPLDGSGNADASICTGTVFGVFENKQKSNQHDDDDDVTSAVLQPACNMRAAGYCLYSSATVLVFTLGEGCVYGFTLDPQTKEFVMTHPNLTIPPRGNVYSCNEANSEGWSDDFKQYLKDLKTGNNQTQRRYAHRYVGSMVGDIHRTLLYGGIFAYPSDTMEHPHGNLQLLYKSAPMAYVVSQAGGKSTNGSSSSATSLLQIQPERIHQKSPCFIGSPQDVDELQTYLVDDKKCA